MIIFIGYKGGNSKKSKYRNNLTKHIDHELDNEAFISRSKDGKEGVFTRDRKLNIRSLVVMIMKFQSSIQREFYKFHLEMAHIEPH